MENKAILTQAAEQELLRPIDEYIGSIQEKINELRKDGTDEVIALNNHIAVVRENANLTKDEKREIILENRKKLEQAKKVEKLKKPEVDQLISQAVSYLDEHYDKEYYSKAAASCEAETAAEKIRYEKELAALKAAHQKDIQKASGSAELKEEKYVYKNKLFDARLKHESTLQEIRDRKHEAFAHRYHLIDLLRLSKFTFAERQKQKLENYRYTFNIKQFLLKNGLYIAILFIFILLCILTPIIKHTQLLTMNNILNILQAASPRMFLALGVGGLILLGGTDLSVGRMVGTSMVLSTMIMHKGINTGALFGRIADRTGTGGLLLCDHAVHYHRGLLHGTVQDSSFHFHHGKHADHVRPDHICNQGRILRCD